MEKSSTVILVRYFDKQKDYDMICAWYSSYGEYPLKPEQYPPTGLVVEVDTAPICAGFIWRTDSVIAVFSMPICDRNADKVTRNLALNKLIESVKVQARAIGAKWIFAPVNNQVFLKRLIGCGFKRLKNEAWYEVV